MLVNNQNDIVQFISYTGEYPCLCVGVLTLKIEGEIVKFGYDDMNPDEDNYDRFWSSGGSCFFIGDFEDEVVTTDEWVIDADELPEKYRKYAPIIAEVFNDNVRHGCCGGCL